MAGQNNKTQADIWWNAREKLVGRKPRRGVPKPQPTSCPHCRLSDKLSVFQSQSPTGRTLYLLGCERCDESIRYVPQSVAIEVE
jgi:hypothetical protein